METEQIVIWVLALGLIGFMVASMVQFGKLESLLKDLAIEKPMVSYHKGESGFFSSNVSGVYIPGCGFFVDTRGRNLEDINDTIHHEYLHGLIEQREESKNHFCNTT